MGMIIIALVASFIPSLIFFFWFKNACKEDADHQKTCVDVLFRGFLSVFPVVLLDLILHVSWNVLLSKHLPAHAWEFFRCFVIAAFVEELVKFSTGNKYVKEKINTVTSFQVIAFMTIAACGFNIIESVVYSIGSDVITVLVRGVTALHEFYGLIMGFYYAKYLVTKNKKYLFPAFLIPFFLHGLYDYSLTPGLTELSDFFIFLPFIVILVTWIIGFRVLVKTVKGKKDGSLMVPIQEVKTGE